MMLEPVQKGVYQGFSFEQVVPLRIVEVGCDDGGFSAVSLVHELEECVDLFGVQAEITQFVDDE